MSNSSKNEVRYQHRGYGKYVEIVNLFGWSALEDFWRSVQMDYMDGITYPRNADPTDHRILRMSRAAGVDLTPLIHFWGVHPEDPAALKIKMEREGLKPSRRVYDRLTQYAALIPMDRAAFVAHANIIHPQGLTAGKSPDFGVGWYYVWSTKYDAACGEAAQQALREMIEMYFPEGRPSP